MGACTSKTRQNKAKHLNNDVTNAVNNNKKDSTMEHAQQPALSVNVDKFDNVPFIDSEEKQATTPPPLTNEEVKINDSNHDNDERTTVKTNFETNVSYSSAETIDKLKQEVYAFLREKIFSNKEEKDKLIDYVHQRIIGSTTDATIIDQCLEQCFDDINKQQHPDRDEQDKIKRRLMNIITVYVSSQSPDNSFLKALYDKLGPTLDLNALNAETTEHEVVNVTVTKTVRQVIVDGSSSVITDEKLNSNIEIPDSIIHLSNNEQNIPADLPDDIRRKAEQVLNSFNDVIHTKSN